MAWYAIRPHDTVFIRDGRTAEAGDGTAFGDVMPRPSTAGGAVGAAIRSSFEYLRGPYLARQDQPGKWTPYLAMPQDVVGRAGRRTRVRPVMRADGIATSDRIGTALTDVDAADRRGMAWEHEPVLVSAAEVGRYLLDAGYSPAGESADRILAPERRIGIAREGGRTLDGYLYQATHRRPVAGAAFVVDTDVDVPTGESVAFGGGGRRAEIEPAETVGLPQRPDSFEGGRVLVYLATPAIWPGGSTPPDLAGAEIVSAAIAPPEAVALGGSRVGRGTALHWAVPAGSVYHLRFPDDDTAVEWAHDHHGLALGDGDLASTGFGVILTGRWRSASE